MSTPTYVIGHKNPDADAICSAIAYTNFKHRIGQTNYIAARCGNSNARIDTILNRFKQPLPHHLSDVTPRVRDVMSTDVLKVGLDTTCAEALELMESRDLRTIPVLASDQKITGMVSIFQLGGFFLPQLKEPRLMRRVVASPAAIARSLKARVLHLVRENTIEELFVRVGAMDVRSFGRYTKSEHLPWPQTVVIVGDRWDIQQKSIQEGVRLLVVSGNLPVDDEIVKLAQERGTSVIISPYDTATSAWVIRAATSVETLTDTKFTSFAPEQRIVDARRRLATLQGAAFPVIDENERLIGIFSKTDLLKPVQTRLVLVDHNELSQAVTGAEEVTIAEIIDHHRLGAPHTNQPILFINEPVGSTCTIVAGLFRREGLSPTPEIAGTLMGGIISDTLHLNSPTTTERDYELLSWLSTIANVPSGQFAEQIFSSGSVILSNPPEKVITTDYKIYEEANVRFAVSQVEELGFTNFRVHTKALADALEKLRQKEELLFSCLLVTDINTQNSLLLVKGDSEFIQLVATSYTRVAGEDYFDMPGIVSRKKQLIPYLSGILNTAKNDGAALG